MISKQEFLLGAASSIIPAVRLGWWGVGLVALTSLLWALGGWEHGRKAIRRYGVPIAVVGACLAILGWHWYFLLGLLGIAVLHLGDSYPDFRPSTHDDGSWLGQLLYHLFGWSDEIGGIATKILAVLIMQICWIPLFI